MKSGLSFFISQKKQITNYYLFILLFLFKQLQYYNYIINIKTNNKNIEYKLYVDNLHSK